MSTTKRASQYVSIGFMRYRRAQGQSDADVGEDEAKHDRELACRAQFNAEEDLKSVTDGGYPGPDHHGYAADSADGGEYVHSLLDQVRCSARQEGRRAGKYGEVYYGDRPHTR